MQDSSPLRVLAVAALFDVSFVSTGVSVVVVSSVGCSRWMVLLVVAWMGTFGPMSSI